MQHIPNRADQTISLAGVRFATGPNEFPRMLVECFADLSAAILVAEQAGAIPDRNGVDFNDVLRTWGAA